jgi:fermentation-respiration switch protein FrsA (DUF1100 family)
MNNLIFIHGGDSFLDASSYIDFLQKSYVPSYAKPWEDVSKKDYRVPIARKWVQEGWKVYYPTMPNKQNARYRDWKIVFEAIMDRLDAGDRLTFVGWSLGGCFLLKYFGEIEKYTGATSMNISEKINLLFIDNIHLLAACISEWEFSVPENYDVLRSLGSKVHIWHAEDDMVVPFSIGEELASELPDAVTHFFTTEAWYGHFHGIERLPELEAVIFNR